MTHPSPIPCARLRASSIPTCVLAATGLLMLGALFTPVHARAPDVPLEPAVHPRNGASTADTVYALFASNCGSPKLDPLRVPIVTRGPVDPASGNVGFVEQVTVQYFIVAAPDPAICPAVVLPDTLTPVDLGHFAKGETAVLQTFKIRTEAGTDYRDLATHRLDIVSVGDTPNPAVSGTWFDPTAPGTGVSLSLTPDADHTPTAVVFLATMSPAGDALWLTGAGKFEDAVLDIPLTKSSASGNTPATSTPAGSLRFEYLGCGKAALSVEGVAVRFPEDEAGLLQLTQTFGLPPCTPPTRRPQAGVSSD